MKLMINKHFTDEAETTSRYTHIKGAELNDSEPYIWTNEEYSYPKDLRPSNIPITEIDNMKIDQVENTIEVKADGIWVVWGNSTKTLKIKDAYSGKNITLKKGDAPVTFDNYYNFAEGRRIKFVVA